MENKIRSIIFAGGCFWGVQKYFKMVPGVVNTIVGYTSGQKVNPTYNEVCSGETGHAEACKLEYDPQQTNLKILTVHFFNIIDPTILNQQGNDIGTQYRTGIYYLNDQEKDEISDVIEKLKENYANTIVVEVKKATEFFKAEDDHQYYLDKNSQGYCHLGKVKFNSISSVDESARGLL